MSKEAALLPCSERMLREAVNVVVKKDFEPAAVVILVKAICFILNDFPEEGIRIIEAEPFWAYLARKALQVLRDVDKYVGFNEHDHDLPDVLRVSRDDLLRMSGGQRLVW